MPYSLGVGFSTRAPTIVAGIRASSAGSGWLVKRGVGSGVTEGSSTGMGSPERRCPVGLARGVEVAGAGSAVEHAATVNATSASQLAIARRRGRAAAKRGVGMGAVRIAAGRRRHAPAPITGA